MKANAHIGDYLEYYMSQQGSPGYAVLLNGTWGIGKTYLVKSLLKEQLHKGECVYVSLYGLSSAEELDQALIAAACSGITSKRAIAGRVLRAAMRYTGIDTGLHPEDVMRGLSAKLYVFDDLERCNAAALDKILGYINELVEHDGCKVLIVANEDEIRRGPDYRRRREKLVGKTLSMDDVLDDALEAFIGEIRIDSVREAVDARRGEISEVYRLSTLQNLRILRQSIADCERVFSVLTEHHTANERAMRAVTQVLLACSFEMKSGRIDAQDLLGRQTGLAAAMARYKKPDAELTAIQRAEKRYGDLDISNPILTNEVLAEILCRGSVSEHRVRASLDGSTYFAASEDEPAWKTVWYGLERPDAQFYGALTELDQQVEARKITTTGEILHIFGIYLWLSSSEIVSMTRADVVNEGKRYIQDLYDSKRLEPLRVDDYDDFRFNSYQGLGMHEAGTPEYREIFNFLQDKRKRVAIDSYPQRANELLEEMRNDTALFYRRVCLTNSTDNIYYSVPILASIDPEAFVSATLSQPPDHQREIVSAFKGRYEQGGLNSRLAQEREWLEMVRESFLDRSKEMSSMGRHRIEKLMEWYVDPYLAEDNSSVEEAG